MYHPEAMQDNLSERLAECNRHLRTVLEKLARFRTTGAKELVQILEELKRILTNFSELSAVTVQEYQELQDRIRSNPSASPEDLSSLPKDDYIAHIAPPYEAHYGHRIMPTPTISDVASQLCAHDTASHTLMEEMCRSEPASVFNPSSPASTDFYPGYQENLGRWPAHVSSVVVPALASAKGAPLNPPDMASGSFCITPSPAPASPPPGRAVTTRYSFCANPFDDPLSERFSHPAPTPVSGSNGPQSSIMTPSIQGLSYDQAVSSVLVEDESTHPSVSPTFDVSWVSPTFSAVPTPQAGRGIPCEEVASLADRNDTVTLRPPLLRSSNLPVFRTLAKSQDAEAREKRCTSRGPSLPYSI